LRKAIGRWLAAVTVGGGLLAAGSPAIAAQAGSSLPAHGLSAQQQAGDAAREASGLKAVPDAVGDESQICLTNAPSYCIHTRGAGNQVAITNVAAQKANFTVVFDVEGDHAWQDGNGNCLREGTGGVVKIENGPCNISDDSDNWEHSQGSDIWKNVETGDEMYTKGTDNGDLVWASTGPGPGAWINWNAPT
jgi:hypothetical protein